MSEPSRGSTAWGVALIAGVLALMFLVGHYGLRPVAMTVAGPSARGPSETRVSAARDLPVPPYSELYASNDAAGDPNRVLLRYVSHAGVEELLAFFEREMPARGWSAMDVGVARKDYPGVLLGYSNLAGSWCMITISRMAQGGVGVTILKMRGAAPRPRAPERPRKEEST